MADQLYVVMTVECQHCKSKQKVHVAARTGFAQVGDQTIQCLMCNNHFKVTVPDRIVGGPFPA
jgi:DNA-directed RNA polymerase subunit M/transcription elongation factor TFIIS